MPAPAAAQSSQPSAVAPAQGARPNILFILADDMGFSDLSVMGNRKVATPHLDRLAQQGVLMTRFYDAAPICSSSRAGFFTGRFPAEVSFVGITAARAKNAQLGQADWLDPKLPNLARMLKGAGYATAHIGKWHMGGGRDIGDAPWPTAYGFDESFTTFEGLGPRVLVSDEERNLSDQSAKLGQGAFSWEVKKNLTPLYGDKTIDFVTRNKDRPWFVQLWLNDVHDPWAPAAEDLATVRGKGKDADDEKFLASLVGMDRALGRVFARLEAMGEAQDTLIIFTSDNGPSPLKRYMKDGATPPGGAGDLRGRKFSLYEGGIRQPLILHWPGHVRAGHRDEKTVGHGVDLLPTLAGIAGAPVGANARGVDLAPVLAGGEVAQRPALFWAYGKEGAPDQPNLSPNPRDVSPRFAVREDDWKLLMNAGGAEVQLYDLAADPNEARNLAASQPAVRDRLMAKLRGWMAGLPK
jgi:arylsulfatase A-like enzyme